MELEDLETEALQPSRDQDRPALTPAGEASGQVRPWGKRRQTLERLFELFEGHDAEAEIRRLKEQDEGF